MDAYFDQVVEDDGESWLHRVPEYTYEQRSMQCERACLDLFDRHAGFCKIHHVVHRGSVIVRSEPDSKSPTKRLWDDPELAILGGESTFMMEATFTGKDGHVKKFGSTGFMVAPGIALSAGHFVEQWDDSGYRGELTTIQGSAGHFIPPGGFRVMGFNCQLLYTINNLSTFPALVGTDLSVFSTDGNGAGQTFLLPCSPKYEDCSEVCSFSFPHVTVFMAEAKKQLQDGEPPSFPQNDIWEAYKVGMQLRAKTLKCKATKDDLFFMLEDTFRGFATGQKVASPGIITECTTAAIKGRYSTLGGSSGAPVCPLLHPGYFIAVHVSACYNSDLNVATSCDNDEFVKHYEKEVLPKLPGPDDVVWKGLDTRPFEDWCGRHGLLWKQQPHPAKRMRVDNDEILLQKSPTTPKAEFLATRSAGRPVN